MDTPGCGCTGVRAVGRSHGSYLHTHRNDVVSPMWMHGCLPKGEDCLTLCTLKTTDVTYLVCASLVLDQVGGIDKAPPTNSDVAFSLPAWAGVA